MSAKSRLGGANRAVAPALARLNGVMSQQFAGLATSPVPVLVPFDVDALLRDQAAGADAGRSPSATCPASTPPRSSIRVRPATTPRLRSATSEVPELSDIKFAEPIEVQISGSALLYDLDAPIAAEGQPVAGLEEEFPGIRRMILEHHLRYTFVRFGVPYVVSIACFDAGVSRYKMPTCRAADQVALRFLRALRVVGGMPRSSARGKAAADRAPDRACRTRSATTGRASFCPAPDFAARAAGRTTRSIRRSAFRSPTRRPSPAPQVYQRRNREHAAEPDDALGPALPWRDNFCERRGFPVGQCPAGIGHQGQDIRPGPCKPPPGMERCTHHGDIVAVRDGVILRSPRQEAAYLFVNSANEHIRFRYLHMNPRKMDADNLLSGRRVHEGEIIGEVSNFSMKEAGTSYHVHFDVQVPTKVRLGVRQSLHDAGRGL